MSIAASMKASVQPLREVRQLADKLSGMDLTAVRQTEAGRQMLQDAREGLDALAPEIAAAARALAKAQAKVAKAQRGSFRA